MHMVGQDHAAQKARVRAVIDKRLIRQPYDAAEHYVVLDLPRHVPKTINSLSSWRVYRDCGETSYHT